MGEFIHKMTYYTGKDPERLVNAELTPARPWRVACRVVRMFILNYLQWRGYRDRLLGFCSSLSHVPVHILVAEAKRREASRHLHAEGGPGLEAKHLNHASGRPTT